MRYPYALILIFLVSCGKPQVPPQAQLPRAPDSRYVVTKVVDGDTFDFKLELTGTNLSEDQVLRIESMVKDRVRLLGVDCPEAEQPYGDKARDFTHELTDGVGIELQATGRDQDGRLLVVCTLPGNKDLAAELVKAGLAWSANEHKGKLAELRKEAAVARRGLWADDNPIHPKVWRKGKREQPETPE